MEAGPVPIYVEAAVLDSARKPPTNLVKWGIKPRKVYRMAFIALASNMRVAPKEAFVAPHQRTSSCYPPFVENRLFYSRLCVT